MKKIFLLSLIWIMIGAFNTAHAIYPPEGDITPVTQINLQAAGEKVYWTTTGYSAQGYKVVWSKNEGPSYPTRSGDQYLYYSEPTKNYALLTPFAGEGEYYVRVCEYLGGKCGLYSNQVKTKLGFAQEIKKDDYPGPIACTMDWNPVCGQDGKTYSNMCMLEAAKVVKAYKGECQAVEPVACTREYAPVCGVDGVTYDNPCLAEKSAKVKIAYHGNCYQVTETAIPVDCLYYYDGCNECKVENQRILGCTKKMCVRQDTPKCIKYKDKEDAPKPKPSQSGMFRFAKWECYDGSQQESQKEADCKKVSEWRQTAEMFCKEACSPESSKCGINSFAVMRDCSPEIANMEDQAGKLQNQKIDELLKELEILRNRVKEQEAEIKYLKSLSAEMGDLSTANQDAIKSFITYGVDDNTKSLGAGERASVIHSYESAYGKLPDNEEELTDLIKIANGRFPMEISVEAEARAADRFVKIYNRPALVDNANDQAAIKIMAYGLKQKATNRNLKSEQQGLKTFKRIFGFHPNQAEANGWTGAEAWNTVQAITYSGAKR